ncbi:hypothetical protein ACJQWK_11862 [Exserohilum turcicum]|uniref:Uncharacterized protein n=1 Tax=Exserohilum turcicum (strain 28A) TaxID=671987 RepID=R0IMC0_EXST2|nr:uncharacterized protein SETTUDRAFT_39637 [Exserohilum turcica Et28A]EOA86140.1 hypothetical protein SETTUDRAFT_39637 [Exserohilum turcica Et28A]
MSSTRPTYHIPFPKDFLAVNTPIKKATPAPAAAEPVVSAHGFLSNRPASGRHQSISSVSSLSSVTAPSEASTISPPSSPATNTFHSPIFGPKIFAPLAVNAKYAPPAGGLKEMSAAERQRRMSFERSAFLSNIY